MLTECTSVLPLRSSSPARAQRLPKIAQMLLETGEAVVHLAAV
jgi:hypothetical protein